MSVEYDQQYDVGYDIGYTIGFDGYSGTGRPYVPKGVTSKAALAGFFTGYTDGFKDGYLAGLQQALREYHQTGEITR